MARRRKRRVYKATRDDEYSTFIREAPSQEYRDLFVLMGWAGLRVSEATSLRWESVNLDDLQLTVIGKGDVERNVDILPEAEKMLRRRQSQIKGPVSIIFEGLSNSGCISPRSVQRVMKAIREANGIPSERGTPHKLRHAFATRSIRDGAPLNVVSDQLGHANIATTSVYLHSVPGQLRRVYERSDN
jgi:site-specific recombinase XerD